MSLDLESGEVTDALANALNVPANHRKSTIVRDWLSAQESYAILTAGLNESSQITRVKYGDVALQGQYMSFRDFPTASARAWSGFLAEGESPPPERLQTLLSGNIVWDLSDTSGLQVLGRVATSIFKRFEEFRQRAAPGAGGGSMESMSGAESANVLFTLKNHRERAERARYDKIIQALEALFPQYEIGIVESEPGSRTPELQFRRTGRQTRTLSQMSAGTNQILTLLINLLGRTGLILFIEHPEALLHPHSMRFLSRLLREASTENQIILTTHDPHFVEPAFPRGLKRLWSSAGFTRISELSPTLSDVEVAQVGTALRDVGKREVVFARSVILVEDESHKAFIVNVAPTLGFDLDAHSVSVIPVGGADGYKPYRTLLEALEIPHILLKDLSWGQPNQFPGEKFFSLGAEIENYLDSQGLAKKHQQAKELVGTGKPRVMEALANLVTDDEVPEIFRELLQSAVSLAHPQPN